MRFVALLSSRVEFDYSKIVLVVPPKLNTIEMGRPFLLFSRSPFHKRLLPMRTLSKTSFAFLTFSVLLLIVPAVPIWAESPTKSPNIILILADDLGWSDTTLFNTTQLYQTPNIERLAARGMTFTRAYATSPLCSPTRAAILTGLHPARTGLTTPNCHIGPIILQASEGGAAPPTSPSIGPTPVSRLKTEYYTLSEMLRDQGYATGHFGKWHLGSEPYSALEHGFDVDIPHWHGPGPAGGFVAPWNYPDFDPHTPKEHIEDRMAEEAVAFMQQHQDEPFFLNYWMFSVHAPFDAKQTLIDKYRRYVGELNPDDPQRSPTYAAMIESMDDAVGTLLDTLDRLKIADNTIIIFASDNGGNMYDTVDNTTPTSNAPLKGGKATMYEGGVRCPMTVVWPGQVKQGTRSDALTQSTDFYPTILDILNVDPKPDQTFDGVSILPALKGKPLDREAIFTYFPHDPKVPDWLPPSVSVHRGDWKLIRIFYGNAHLPNAPQPHRYKLYDLKEDIGETNDLSSQRPELVEELDALIEQFLIETNAVRAVANPKFDRSKYDIEKEGIKAMNKPAAKPAPREASPPVAGWHGSGDAILSVNNDQMVMNSLGGDPYMDFQLAQAKDTAMVELSFRASASGNGQVFWKEKGSPRPYNKSESEVFDVVHDGETHRYRIAIEAKQPIIALRIDPARGKGEIGFDSIKLINSAGQVTHEWTFGL